MASGSNLPAAGCAAARNPMALVHQRCIPRSRRAAFDGHERDARRGSGHAERQLGQVAVVGPTDRSGNGRWQGSFPSRAIRGNIETRAVAGNLYWVCPASFPPCAAAGVTTPLAKSLGDCGRTSHSKNPSYRRAGLAWLDRRCPVAERPTSSPSATPCRTSLVPGWLRRGRSTRQGVCRDSRRT
jgi:hypothetical protein